MKPKKRAQKMLRQFCAEVHPEDGLDPRDLARRPRPRRSDRQVGRKTQQLCSQVARTLNEVLAGQCDDDVLRSLYVVAVAPAPDASRMLVTVGVVPPLEAADPRVILERLGHVSGRLRAEVAAAITRRRTPTLEFQFVDLRQHPDG